GDTVEDERDPHQQRQRCKANRRAGDDHDPGHDLDHSQDDVPRAVSAVERLHEPNNAYGDEPDADQQSDREHTADRMTDEQHSHDHTQDADDGGHAAVFCTAAHGHAEVEDALDQHEHPRDYRERREAIARLGQHDHTDGDADRSEQQQQPPGGR